MLPVVLSANSQAAGYRIPKSLRFRSSASAYLSRTPASAGNQTTWTWSGWVKRGTLGVVNELFQGYSSASNRTDIQFNASNQLFFNDPVVGFTTNAVFRDPSAWYHIVIAYNSSNATQANRLICYVNGVQQTFASVTYPTLNQVSYINGAWVHYLGAANSGGFAYFDGYLAEINFIDGQALTPSSFGETSSTTGVWIPKQYSGTYGTNGFYLKFTDTTSTTALGYDSSGNGNNWTPNNLSLTTGSTYDSMLDSPTNYDNGGNGVGNYAVLNPLNVNGSTLSEANLKASYIVSTNGNSQARGSFAVASGKWYWEVLLSNVVSGCLIGIVKSDSAYNVGFNTANSWLYYSASGAKWNGSSSAYAASSTTGDIIGVAFDSDNGTLTFYKNGSSLGQAFSGLTGISLSPVAYDDAGNNTTVLAFNFGQRPFAYTPPTGYKALNTQNLSAPSIVNGAGYMAASLYTGNSGTQSIVNAVNGVSFAPDFVWLKIRSTTGQHVLSDTIRGPSVQLFSSLTNAETTESGKGITAFNSNGFTLGNELAVTGSSNLSGATYVGWQWKAGGTAVTNTAGSITSSVSANTTAGFSVVTYTGTGVSNPTVGHGLGIAPNMIILKARNVAGQDWLVMHQSTAADQFLVLDTTAAVTNISATSGGAISTTTTSTTFLCKAGTASSVNTNNNGTTYVAYCFAAIPGYNAFGSYTGNGSSDGPFVFLGFRPRWIMIKLTSASGENWEMYDTSRGPYNLYTPDLYANLSNAEGTNSNRFDILSNGLKIRSANGGVNNSGGTYIYAAFAENPFQISRAR